MILKRHRPGQCWHWCIADQIIGSLGPNGRNRVNNIESASNQCALAGMPMTSSLRDDDIDFSLFWGARFEKREIFLPAQMWRARNLGFSDPAISGRRALITPRARVSASNNPPIFALPCMLVANADQLSSARCASQPAIVVNDISVSGRPLKIKQRSKSCAIRKREKIWAKGAPAACSSIKAGSLHER